MAQSPNERKNCNSPFQHPTLQFQEGDSADLLESLIANERFAYTASCFMEVSTKDNKLRV
jgi:hypothetical protein